MKATNEAQVPSDDGERMKAADIERNRAVCLGDSLLNIIGVGASAEPTDIALQENGLQIERNAPQPE